MQRDNLLKTTAASPKTDTEVVWSAALAEALHVDGHYSSALAIWRRLVLQTSDPALRLKLAIAWSEVGRNCEAEMILEEISQLAEFENEVRVVRGQLAWREARVEGANALFAEALRKDPDNLFALNAWGVMNARIGACHRARELLTTAAEKGDPLAVFNSVLDSAHGEFRCDKLDVALTQAPHRFEGHVGWSRLCASRGEARQQAAALKRAQVRKAFRPEPRTEPQSNFDVWAKGTIGPDGVDMEVRIESEAAKNLSFHLNPSLSCTSPVKITQGSTKDLVRFSASCSDTLILHIQGKPTGRALAIESARVELAGPSCWLPIIVGNVATTYHLDLSPPDGWEITSAGYKNEPNTPFVAALPYSQTRFGMTVLSQSDLTSIHIQLARTRILFERMLSLWCEITAWPTPEPLPDVVCVDVGNSQFCFALNSLVHIPRGVVESPSGVNLICHEISHTFWNRRLSFASSADWWREGLAEYGLHLAEDAGIVSGYRTGVNEKIRNRPDLARKSILSLARTPDPEAQDMYRLKAGYVIRMLRSILGKEAFAGFLEVMSRRSTKLSDYEAEALASWIAPNSLRWFFEQWVRQDADLTAECISLGQKSEGPCEIRLLGWATPGHPVLVETFGKTGETSRENYFLERGSARLPKPLYKTVIDPDLDWFGLHLEVT